ncbi:IucA/IucC family protein [Paenibacillus sp. LHD-38]|uniref:IucA/IucC family protein n=1 Tax=Paenibacillus sp. LHD-38 TaxID=3072143 RepID=UPI00280DB914|nr:IucA/IucC family protein [Paenibacillus sp. LHD-38]MDQ8738880.1 IucA/IucC family protein [Paenibacillus sp. LHD-38]
MDYVLSQTRSKAAAESRIRKELMDAFLAERFFLVNEITTGKLLEAPDDVQKHYPGIREASVYVGEVCFLVEPSYRQGVQWVADSPILKKEGEFWAVVDSPMEICNLVLRYSLSEEAYSHPGVTDFLEGLDVAIRQLSLSLEQASEHLAFAPNSAYEWFVKGERLSSLRDRPFHPLSKAKIGFEEQDYREYMAEFGNKTKLYWVAIANDSVSRGCEGDGFDCLEVLDDRSKASIEEELAQKGLSKEAYTLIPVHPWQLNNRILPDFRKEIEEGTVILLETQAGEFLATSSLRSFASTRESTKMLKLPISVKSLGAARYLPVVKLLNGLVGERLLRQAIACDDTLANRVFLCEEKHWWGYMPRTMGLFDDHPRHLAAQLRIYPSEIMDEGYKIIPMSSLGVTLNGGHFLSEIRGGRPSQEEAIRFYADVAAMFYDITMRLFKVGVVPEIHGQNCCLVLKDGEVAGMLFRDHDSVRLHQPYLDKHGIEDPCYHIRPGYSNSLYNETIEKLIFYVQSLGTQVNLASIMESLSEAYAIPEKRLWDITEKELREAVQRIDVPEIDRSALLHSLFESDAWPSKLIIRPLLETGGVPGAMPSGKGVGHNPFRYRSI